MGISYLNLPKNLLSYTIYKWKMQLTSKKYIFLKNSKCTHIFQICKKIFENIYMCVTFTYGSKRGGMTPLSKNSKFLEDPLDGVF